MFDFFPMSLGKRLTTGCVCACHHVADNAPFFLFLRGFCGKMAKDDFEQDDDDVVSSSVFVVNSARRDESPT